MTYLLNATKREQAGAKVRTKDNLPGVVYGGGKENYSLNLVYNNFVKLYKEAGTSSLIDLEVDGKNVGKVLVHDIQLDPITNRVTHVDFRRIDMSKKMKAPVALRFIGEAPAVKEFGGTLVRTISEISVECLPQDLISHVDIDLSILKTFDDAIKIKDLQLPAGIKVLSPHAEDLVVKAAPAITEEEIKKMEESSTKEVDLSKIEVTGKKKEDEEAVEGEVAPAEKKEEKKEEKKK